MRVLIDANTYRLPAAGAYVHLNDELDMWGPHIVAMRRYQYRFRPPRKRTDAKEAAFIPALALRGPDFGVEFFIYWLLEYEMENMPPAYDWIGRSIRDLFDPTSLPRRPPSYRGFICRSGVTFDFKSELRKFIGSVEDSRFKEILAAFGPDDSQDAFHVWTCEREAIDFIITTDGPFQNKLRQMRRTLSIKVDARRPSEICKRLGIAPVPPEWFDENDNFRNTSLVKLFDRRASLKDRMVFRVYRGCMSLSKRLGLPVNFVIPGYGR